MSASVDRAPFTEPARTTAAEVDYRAALERRFLDSSGTTLEKLQNFPRFVPTQDLRRFLCRHEIYKRILGVHGAIVECGVLHGGGLFSWAQLSEIYEPFNHTRNVIGFDTFAGFPHISEKDAGGGASQLRVGGLAADVEQELGACAAVLDRNRVLGHIRKIRLVRGDAVETIPRFVEEHAHLVVALLWLDFDVYEPTRAALRHLLPRMPRGAVLAFDELAHEVWPGETVAAMEEVGLGRLRLERFPFGSTASFAVLE